MTSVLSSRVWVWAFVICAINLIWLALSRVGLVWGQIPILIAPVFCYGLGLLALRRIADGAFAGKTMWPEWLRQRAAALLWTLLFLNFTWINMRVLNHLVMTTALPFQDDALAWADRMIGFDWLAVFNIIAERPWLIAVLNSVYYSLTPLSVVAMVLLIAMGQIEKAALFLESFLVVAVLCIVIGLAFPALGTFVHFGLQLQDYPNFETAPGTFFVSALHKVRMPEGEILLDPMSLAGLAAFPSLHTAAAVVLGLAFRQTRLAKPAAVYAGLIIAATPVFGGHYAVDLLAGALLAVVVFFAVAKVQKSKRGAITASL